MTHVDMGHMASNNYRLMLVDDEPDLLALLREVLAGTAKEILTASNGQEALELIQNDQSGSTVDAILCDIQMPKLDGLQFLEKMRRERILTPLVFLSAFGDRARLVRALQLGAYDFLDKPFRIEELIKRLTPALEYGSRLRTVISSAESNADAKGLTGKNREDFLDAQIEILLMRHLNPRKKIA